MPDVGGIWSLGACILQQHSTIFNNIQPSSTFNIHSTIFKNIQPITRNPQLKVHNPKPYIFAYALFSFPSRIIVTCSNRLFLLFTKRDRRTGIQTGSHIQNRCGAERNPAGLHPAQPQPALRQPGTFSVAEFKAFNANDLYRALVDFPWEDIIAADGYFSISNNVSNDTINNSPVRQCKGERRDRRPLPQSNRYKADSGPELDRTVIHLYWKESLAEVFIDTSGETLSKHGYRKIPGKAPMLESLAAASFAGNKWDRRSPVVNPMCGSGTIAIEAALIATHRKPGLLRGNYAFMHLVGYKRTMV